MRQQFSRGAIIVLLVLLAVLVGRPYLELAAKLLDECPQVSSVLSSSTPKICRSLCIFFFALGWLFVFRCHAIGHHRLRQCDLPISKANRA
jgi:protein-S-isoprenylcysteine O-methyltransferase Ste14